MFFPYENISNDDNMSRKRIHGQLIGIRLLPESYRPECLNTDELNKGKIIGTVFIPIEGTTCSQLRQAINKSLDVPKEYCFLNAAGWPFDSSLEDKIFIVDCLISNVVTVQRKHPKLSRIGIKLLDGPVLGFIYLNFNYEIRHIRDQIKTDLGDLFEVNESFEFVDNNYWPVRQKQELEISVWDLVSSNCITIVKKQIKRSFGDEDNKTDKRPKLLWNSNEITSNENGLDSHLILISYVHREATVYAQDLKKALKNIGFMNIFLDIDDIPPGNDWQDIISSTVDKCSVFIPLVTPGYGETRWTNREAKLADDREKLIIPISFLDKWPPDQLAIQFLSLQYIPWQTSDENNGGNFSGESESVWNHKSIRRVANEIKKLCSDTDVLTPSSASLLDGRSHASIDFTLNLPSKHKKKVHTTERIFIVISAHSKQQKFVEEKIIKVLESQGYNTWSSMNLCECDETSFSPIEDSYPMNSTFENSSIGNGGHSSVNAKSLKSIFKEKVKAAKLVVLVFSEDYIKSSICRQQAFYCEQRKKNLVIKHGNFPIDSTLLNLYNEEDMISVKDLDCLKYKIDDKLKFDHASSYRNSVNLMVTKLKSCIDTSMAVYIIGATEKIAKYIEEFCRNLGTELAKVNKLNLVTGGVGGVGDIVGRNFCEEQEIMNKGQAPKVYHIVPETDSSVDSFQKLPYGKTLHFGMSETNRDDIVASVFKLCILIAGGESAACLAEKFLFNDCTVIPVLHSCSRKTALKNYLKDSMSKVPNNVNEMDWQNLNGKISTEARAKTVTRVICAVLNI